MRGTGFAGPQHEPPWGVASAASLGAPLLMEIFDYDNILLLPRKCRVESRAECDTSVEFGGRRFGLPVVPANMKTVIDEPISETLARSGHFYVMHRFDLDAVAYARRMRDQGLFVSISSGVTASNGTARSACSRSTSSWIAFRNHGSILVSRWTSSSGIPERSA